MAPLISDAQADLNFLRSKNPKDKSSHDTVQMIIACGKRMNCVAGGGLDNPGHSYFMD